MERQRLSKIRKIADEIVNTSNTTIHDLKKILTKKYMKKKGQMMQVVIVSFGYKYGIPLDSDLVLDTRFLPNPFYIDKLREKTGKSKAVQDYVLNSRETRAFQESLKKFLDYLMPQFIEEGKSYLTIAIGCTGGKHRSVVLGEELKKYLREKKFQTRINHRDIYK